MRHALPMVILAGLWLPAIASDEKPSARREDQEALKVYGDLVGSWRGAGQPRRGQSAGSWKENATWAWKLSENSAALAIEIEGGKHLKSAVLQPGKKAGEFALEATLADGSKRIFAGQSTGDDKPLVLTAEGLGEGVRRVTLSIPNANRFLMLMESEPASRNFARLGEVGFTRNGVAFAAGESGPICIVTGGRGTVQVSHKGKSYYVCCSGCKDLFNQDPEAVLAEAAKKAKEKEKEKK